MGQSGAIRSRLETLKHRSEPATLGLEGPMSETLYGWLTQGEKAASGPFFNFFSITRRPRQNSSSLTSTSSSGVRCFRNQVLAVAA